VVGPPGNALKAFIASLGLASVTVATRFVPRREFDRIRRLNAAPAECAGLIANLARINTLYMIKRAGSGHIGSSFSSLDIVSWLHLHELSEGHGLYFSSKGHDAPGLYAVLTGFGSLPMDMVHRLRRLNGLPGHPDIGTPGIVANTGSLGMGISKAKGFVYANRRTGHRETVFVLTGDGELQEGQIWESLGQAANRGYGEIVAIVDHNKLQSDTWVEQVSALGDLEAKFVSFGWHVQRCNGHDFDALAACIGAAKANAKQPSVIIADTIKGKGVSFMEPGAGDGDEIYRFHSGAPTDGDFQRAHAELKDAVNAELERLGGATLALDDAPPPEKTPAAAARPQSLTEAYADALLEWGGRNANLVVLDGDLMLDCGLIPFKKAFPERFVECGIAEQDMVSQAGAMALKGLVPVVHSFACFLTPRANEQIYNNATELTKVIYVGFLAGLLPGGPGHSHQSVRDIGILGNVPNLTLIEPSCASELSAALSWAIETNRKSTYLRLVSIPCDMTFELPPDYTFTPGRGAVLRDGRDICVVAYGPVMLSQALAAAERVAAQSISIKVLNLPWLNQLDVAWLDDVLGDCAAIMTLDNHYLAGGQGEMIAAALARAGIASKRRIVSIGLKDIPACGHNDEVLRHHELDADSLATRMVAIAEARDLQVREGMIL
jgi:transketolase